MHGKLLRFISPLILLALGCVGASAPLAGSSPGPSPSPSPSPAPVAAASIWVPPSSADPEALRLAAVGPYKGDLPSYAKVDADIESLYRWSATHYDVLRYMQCTCSCYYVPGHQSNWSCFVQKQSGADDYVWEPMAAG